MSSNTTLQDSESVVFQSRLTLSSSSKEKQIKALFIIIDAEDNSHGMVQESLLSWLPVKYVHAFYAVHGFLYSDSTLSMYK